MNEILDKILPYEARAEFFQIFCSFFGQWSFKKNAFKIYWPLVNEVFFSANFAKNEIFIARAYLQPHYDNGVFGNVYLSAEQH